MCCRQCIQAIQQEKDNKRTWLDGTIPQQYLQHLNYLADTHIYNSFDNNGL